AKTNVARFRLAGSSANCARTSSQSRSAFADDWASAQAVRLAGARASAPARAMNCSRLIDAEPPCPEANGAATKSPSSALAGARADGGVEGACGIVAEDGEDDTLQSLRAVLAHRVDHQARTLLEREAADAGAEGRERDRRAAELVRELE